MPHGVRTQLLQPRKDTNGVFGAFLTKGFAVYAPFVGVIMRRGGMWGNYLTSRSEASAARSASPVPSGAGANAGSQVTVLVSCAAL